MKCIKCGKEILSGDEFYIAPDEYHSFDPLPFCSLKCVFYEHSISTTKCSPKLLATFESVDEDDIDAVCSTLETYMEEL